MYLIDRLAIAFFLRAWVWKRLSNGSEVEYRLQEQPPTHNLFYQTSFFKIFEVTMEGRDRDVKNFGILMDIDLAKLTEPINDFS